MTECIATVGDVFIGTKDQVYVEGIDDCESYLCDNSLILGRALITEGAIYEDDGEVHFSRPFACKPLDISSLRRELF